MNVKTLHACNQEQTDVFVEEFAKSITMDSIVILNGELGTGKTYISSKIASFFGIGDLTSSSFQRVNSHQGRVNIVHCDFYRYPCDYNFFCTEIEPLLIHPWLLLLEWIKPEKYISDFGCTTEILIHHRGGCKRELVLTNF